MLKYIDILVVTEAKLDETFLKSLFLMDGFSKPHRLYRNKNGGRRIMIFMRDTTSSKLLEKHIFLNHVKSILVKLNFRKRKWLLYVTYCPAPQSDEYFFNNIDQALDTYSRYDKFSLVRVFINKISEHRTESFLYIHEICYLIKEKTCFNIQNPSCIDLLLSNNVYAFQQTIAICTGVSDCHKFFLTVLKTTFPRRKPKEITCRDYKQFDSSKSKKELKNVLTKENIDSCTKFDEQLLKF